MAARQGAIDFDDLQSRRREYRSMQIYAQSKLACLMFALEFHRKAQAAGWGVASLAAHPGISSTNLLDNAPGAGGHVPMIYRVIRATLMQSPAQGALPTLFAATAPEAKSGAYYGPNRMSETRGHPALWRVPR